MTGWKQHPVEVNRCWEEVRWVVWNAVGGVYACPWCGSCDVGGGDGGGRARGGGGAWEAVVVVERCWGELELDQLGV